MDSLCHPCITTTHLLSHSVLYLKLPPPPCAVLVKRIKMSCRFWKFLLHCVSQPKEIPRDPHDPFLLAAPSFGRSQVYKPETWLTRTRPNPQTHKIYGRSTRRTLPDSEKMLMLNILRFWATTLVEGALIYCLSQLKYHKCNLSHTRVRREETPVPHTHAHTHRD